MSMLIAGAGPGVLRCARCGHAADWKDARLQVVCECRPRFDLPPVYVREAGPPDADAALALFQRHFRRAEVVAFGELLALPVLPAVVADMNGEVAGVLAYRRVSDALQIVALAADPVWQRSGVGGHLVAEVELMARQAKASRVIACTSNDNLPSLYFYQRRGYRITEVVPGALLPYVTPAWAPGFAGIPVRDEIRIEKTLC